MIRIASTLVNYCHPTIMGILNVTPDSFALHCASLENDEILSQCRKLVEQGATVVDIGACSTRPQSSPVDEQEEWRRLQTALTVVRSAFPDLIISIDTFRASIAQRAIRQFDANIINDVSGLQNPDMLKVVASAHVPYILVHPEDACSNWTDQTDPIAQIIAFFAYKLDKLHQHGVTDVILDPGLGFGKTLEQNYSILRNLATLRILGQPIMVGLSRKSMIYRPLNVSPQQALNGTTAAHSLAATCGADCFRVHDVAEMAQTLQIVQLYQGKQIW